MTCIGLVVSIASLGCNKVACSLGPVTSAGELCNQDVIWICFIYSSLLDQKAFQILELLVMPHEIYRYKP